MSLPLTAVKLIKVSPRCNIPVASAPWDYWRVTIIQSNEPLIPSITVNERRQSALFQTGRHTHRGRERSEMSIGTCWIPQVSQCAAVCMGARLILRLYAKFALSNAQRRGPRPHNPPDPPPPNRHTRTHARAPRLMCLRRQLIGQEVTWEQTCGCCDSSPLVLQILHAFFPQIFCLTGWQDHTSHWHPKIGWTLMIQCINLRNYKAI